jgi:hypothetical protein
MFRRDPGVAGQLVPLGTCLRRSGTWRCGWRSGANSARRLSTNVDTTPCRRASLIALASCAFVLNNSTAECDDRDLGVSTFDRARLTVSSRNQFRLDGRRDARIGWGARAASPRARRVAQPGSMAFITDGSFPHPSAFAYCRPRLREYGGTRFRVASGRQKRSSVAGR